MSSAPVIQCEAHGRMSVQRNGSNGCGSRCDRHDGGSSSAPSKTKFGSTATSASSLMKKVFRTRSSPRRFHLRHEMRNEPCEFADDEGEAASRNPVFHQTREFASSDRSDRDFLPSGTCSISKSICASRAEEVRSNPSLHYLITRARRKSSQSSSPGSNHNQAQTDVLTDRLKHALGRLCQHNNCFVLEEPEPEEEGIGPNSKVNSLGTGSATTTTLPNPVDPSSIGRAQYSPKSTMDPTALPLIARKKAHSRPNDDNEHMFELAPCSHHRVASLERPSSPARCASGSSLRLPEDPCSTPNRQALLALSRKMCSSSTVGSSPFEDCCNASKTNKKKNEKSSRHSIAARACNNMNPSSGSCASFDGSGNNNLGSRYSLSPQRSMSSFCCLGTTVTQSGSMNEQGCCLNESESIGRMSMDGDGDDDESFGSDASLRISSGSQLSSSITSSTVDIDDHDMDEDTIAFSMDSVNVRKKQIRECYLSSYGLTSDFDDSDMEAEQQYCQRIDDHVILPRGARAPSEGCMIEFDLQSLDDSILQRRFHIQTKLDDDCSASFSSLDSAGSRHTKPTAFRT